MHDSDRQSPAATGSASDERVRPNDWRRDWRRYGAFYQIYPRSFADSDGDGIGDLTGVRHRLAYVASLGVDGIWLNPWFTSPFIDGGYDVADYRGVHPWFGTIDDVELLLNEAADLGLKVLFDLVPNHTSVEHPWFQDALSAPGSAARRRYHFLEGRGPTGELPPNDWESVFGGEAWTRVGDGEWYLHMFDPGQPDLNWSNPEVRDEFDDIIRFWIDKGASGLRVDVAHCLTKDMTYPNWRGPLNDHHIDLGFVHPYRDRDDLHDIIRHWRELLDSYADRELIMVAEAIVSPWERLANYLRPDEYHQAFNFEFLGTPWDAAAFRHIIEESLAGARSVGALPTWVWSNHDVVRHTTRLALPNDVPAAQWLLDGDRAALDDERGRRRARAAAMLAMALPGSYYMYQGEELGLPEAYELPTDVLADPIYERSGRTLKGRDGCRVPLPWNAQPPSFGFGPNPWIPMPDDWGDYAVEVQDGRPDSTLELYRRCLALRSERLRHDEFDWIDDDDHAVAFRRGDLTCVVNLGPQPIELPPGRVLAASEPVHQHQIRPDVAVWLTSDD